MLRRLVGEFREFALKGSMVDLAVAVVLGVAFNAVVQSLANDILLNLVAAVFGRPDFSAMFFELNGAAIRYGAFLTAVVNFLLVALALFFVVRAFNRLRRPRGAPVQPPATRECPYCLTPVPVQARRCPACTSEIEPLAGPRRA